MISGAAKKFGLTFTESCVRQSACVTIADIDNAAIFTLTPKVAVIRLTQSTGLSLIEHGIDVNANG